MGLQVGFFCAAAVQAIAFMSILRIKNWQDVADQAIERIEAEKERLA